jgi:hypothetical protein
MLICSEYAEDMKTNSKTIYQKTDWDKELDRGKLKKVKKKKDRKNSFNYFQATQQENDMYKKDEYKGTRERR